MSLDRHFVANRERNRSSARLVALARRLRPTFLASPVLRWLGGRRIVEAEGLRLYLDPASHLGHEVTSTGTYEPDTVALFRARIGKGASVLDIGANEGFLASLAATLVGDAGRVVAVEPQSRLLDVLQINLALNASCPADVIHAAIGSATGAARINLYPVSNTGAASLVSKYRFGGASEEVPVVTPTSLAHDLGIDRFDFVKVDVEGFEPEVVDGLLPLVETGRVGTLLLDYHAAILAERGKDPRVVHEKLVAAGMGLSQGSVGAGYVLYEFRN